MISKCLYLITNILEKKKIGNYLTVVVIFCIVFPVVFSDSLGHGRSIILHVPFWISYLFILWRNLLLKSILSFFDGFIVTTLPILFTLITHFYGYHHFGGYDLSMLIDASWRAYIGQIPFVDFYFTVPPLFFIGGKLAFLLFGPKWSSILLFNTLFSLLQALIVIAILKLYKIRALYIVPLILTGLLLPTWITSHWWHSIITNSTGVVFIISCWCFLQNPSFLSSKILIILAGGGLILCKPNVAYPLYMSISIIVFYFSTERILFLLLLIAGLLFSLSVLLLNSIDPILLIKSYMSIAKGRAKMNLWIPPEYTFFDSLLLLFQYAVLFLPLAISLFFFNKSVFFESYEREDLAVIFLSFSSIFCGLLGLKTNWDIKNNDFTLIVIGSAMISHVVYENFSRSDMKNLLIFSIVFSVSTLTWVNVALGKSRWRNHRVGYGSFFEFVETEEVVREGFFINLRTGHRFNRVLLQVKEVLDKVSDRNHVFMGPRIECLYAQFQITSPSGLPIWWHPGSAYCNEDIGDIIKQFKSLNFEAAIFLKNDFTRMPSEIIEYLYFEFERDNSLGDLTVFYRL